MFIISIIYQLNQLSSMKDLLKSLQNDIQQDPERYRQVTKHLNKQDRYNFKKRFVKGEQLPKNFELFFKLLDEYGYRTNKMNSLQ